MAAVDTPCLEYFMTTLSQLTATPSEAPDHPIQARTTVLDEPFPGFFRQIQLADTGLYIRHNADAIFIPLAELIRLAAEIEPKLVPPAKPGVGALQPVAPEQS